MGVGAKNYKEFHSLAVSEMGWAKDACVLYAPALIGFAGGIGLFSGVTGMWAFPCSMSLAVAYGIYTDPGHAKTD